MSLNPVQFGAEVIDQFGRWLLTTFPIADRELEAQVKEQLRHDVGGERLIAKGPYIYLNRPFEQGPSVSALVEEAGLKLHPALPAIFPYTGVHKHQELALRSIKSGKHTIVATGTGSGKTEAFLLPIVDHCLRLRDEGAAAGLVAILVYPMNALADDQLRRLRPMLAGTGVTFGRYTGNTPQSDEPPQGRLATSRRYTAAEMTLLDDGREEEVPIPFEECCNRDEIQRRRPRILISNYNQLEYLLLRDQDLDLFRSAPLSFLVCDEVHTYTGALGSEVACLIRRLRAVARKSPAELICIGTSATVQDSSGKLDSRRAISSFAANLFGVPETDIALVEERYRRPDQMAGGGGVPPPPGNPKALLQAILEESRQYRLKEAVEEVSNRLLELAEELCGDKAPEGPTPMARIFGLLERNQLVRTLNQSLSSPRLLFEALRSLRPLERSRVPEEDLAAELLCYLTLGALARRDDEPLLRPKLHYFVQGFQGLACSFDESDQPRLHFDIDAPAGDAGAMRFPLVLCRSCGQHFVQVVAGESVREGTIGLRATRRAGRFEEPGMGESLVYFTNRLIGLDEELAGGVHEAWLCRFCGTLHDGRVDSCGNLACKRKGVLKVHCVEGEMKRCAACGTYAKGYEEIVTQAHSSEVADVTIISQTMLSAMQEEPLQKLLVFSDNRQDAAFQAGWMQERSRRFRLRHLLHEVLRSEPGHTWSLKKLTTEIVERGKQHGLFKLKTHDPEDDEIRVRWFLLQEFASSGQRRSSIESLGLAEVVYLAMTPEEAPRFYERWAGPLRMSPPGLQNLIRTILDCHRRRGIVSDRLLCHEWTNRDSDVRRGLVQIADRYYPQALVYEKPRKSSLVRAFRAANGASGTQEIVRKAMADGEQRALAQLRNEFIEELWAMLVREEVLVPVLLTHKRGAVDTPLPVPGQPHQINVDYIGIRVPEGHFVCNGCRRSQSVSLPSDACPEHRCNGTVEWREVDPSNFDVFQYTQTRFVPLKAAEHSAQVPGAERRRIEEQFKKERGGSYNCLVCTPTLELGVDIGKLEMALMRNVPPTPANYAQRAGRAGRRHRIAVVFTYCRSSNHDRYFFGSPEAMISGEIRVPAFSMRNEPLVRKHVHSAILTALRERVDDAERKELNLAFPTFVHSYFADEVWVGEEQPRLRYLDFPRDLSALSALCRRYRDDLVTELRRTFGATWPEVEGREELVGEEALGRFVDQFAADLGIHVRRLFGQVKSFRNEIRRLNDMAEREQLKKDEADDLRRHRLALEALSDRNRQENYGLSYLSVDGFLPGYAMARQQVTAHSLEPFLLLSRPAPVALREFTPANFVYANRNVYRPRRIDVAQAGPAGEANGSSGRHRLFFEKGSERLVSPRGSALEGGLSSDSIEFESLLLTSVELLNRRDINDTEKQRHRISFQLYGQPLERHQGGRVGKIGDVTFRFLLRQTLRLVNLGPRSGRSGFSLFPVCSACGATRSPTATEAEVENFVQVHKKLHGRETVSRFALHVEFESDTLHLGPFSSQEKAVNLFEAIRIGARHLLDMGETELEGFLYSSPTSEQWIALYDPMPGGSGFLPLALEYWEALCERARHALSRCATNCEKACYSCMQHFRNQQWHGLLDRHAAINLLLNLEQPLSLAHAVNSVTIQPKVEVKQTDSDAELDFARICAAHNFPIPPVCQFKVELGSGDFTLADWAWPERKVLVFVDGMSRRFHGNPEQQKKDAQKRARCLLKGYFTVQITAESLSDEAYMAAKFEELHTLLGE